MQDWTLCGEGRDLGCIIGIVSQHAVRWAVKHDTGHLLLQCEHASALKLAKCTVTVRQCCAINVLVLAHALWQYESVQLKCNSEAMEFTAATQPMMQTGAAMMRNGCRVETCQLNVHRDAATTTGGC